MGWILSLLFAALVFYTDDYVVAGVLPEIAADLRVSEGTAGQLVTVFSLTVAVVAPLAAVVLSDLPRRALFTASLLVFVAANVAAAFATSFPALMLLRVCAATAAAAATPALFSTAAALAPADRVGRYIAVVAAGVTGSIALGVPFGTWIGGGFGWRWTFGSLAIAALIALACLKATLMEPEKGTAPRLSAQLRTLASPALSLGFLANALLMAGSMMLLTYLAPFLRELADVDVQMRGAVFGAAGVAGVAGIWLGGSATDRWGPDRTLAIGVCAFLTTMGLLALLWLVRPVTVGVVVPIALVWAGAAFWNSPAIQARIFRLAGSVAQQAMGLNTSFTYLGVALGGAIGGALLQRSGVGSLPWAAIGFGVAALLTFRAAAVIAERQRAERG